MKLGRKVTSALIAAALLAAVAGCQKEGPAERAGKSVDQTMDKAGSQIEKAGESIKDSVSGDKK